MRKTGIKIIFIILLAALALLVDLPKESLAKVGLDNTWFGSHAYRLGLDLQGGTQLRYRIDLGSVQTADRDQVVSGILDVIEKRVNGLGVSEAIIQKSSIGTQEYVIVELPGVKDIQQAIKAVGKTVQLEFKEFRTEFTEAELEDIRARNASQEQRALDILARVNKGDNFEQLAREFSEAGNISEGGIVPEQTKEELGTQMGDIAFNLTDGGVHPKLLQTETQYIILKTLSHGTRTKADVMESASARHILIAYEGAESSSATRTKEEGQKLAQELFDRLGNGEDFVALASEHSDDATKSDGGNLGTFNRGRMVKEFEDAVFGAKAGDLVGPIETEFGFHVIKVESIQLPGESEQESVVTTAQIVFNREPETPLDGWVASTLTGKQFKHAAVQVDQASMTYLIAIEFNDEGKQLFAELTKKNIGRPLAIFLDNEMISAPTVQQEITGGTAVITGQFTPQEASALARDLNTGAIPAPVVLIGQSTVGATLGADALATGLKAGLVGTIFLMLFMLVYYRLPGLVANLALIVYALLVIAIFKLWPITLTLAGIAGFILSMGMAVDANVLIFERMREELKAGKSLATAAEEGFARAWSAIRDSNISSLITCAILWIFGTSIIRGFAITLSIGILVSMFTAIVITRNILRFFIKPSLQDKSVLWGVKSDSTNE